MFTATLFTRDKTWKPRDHPSVDTPCGVDGSGTAFGLKEEETLAVLKATRMS